MIQRCGMTWDNLGQISDGKTTIPKSNIVDLINYLTCSMSPRNANVVGLENVVNVLQNFNAPQCLFGVEGKKFMMGGGRNIGDGQDERMKEIDGIDETDVGTGNRSSSLYKRGKKNTWISVEKFKFLT